MTLAIERRINLKTPVIISKDCAGRYFVGLFCDDVVGLTTSLELRWWLSGYGSRVKVLSLEFVELASPYATIYYEGAAA